MTTTRCVWCDRELPDRGTPICSHGELDALISQAWQDGRHPLDGPTRWLCSEHGPFVADVDVNALIDEALEGDGRTEQAPTGAAWPHGREQGSP
jgi:hypothetical protein